MTYKYIIFPKEIYDEILYRSARFLSDDIKNFFFCDGDISSLPLMSVTFKTKEPLKCIYLNDIPTNKTPL